MFSSSADGLLGSGMRVLAVAEYRGLSILNDLYKWEQRVGPYDIHCCTERQFVLLLEFCVFLAVGVILWRSRLIFPFKLFGTMLHELSHALAACLCCAQVDGIELHSDQSGTCHWSAPRHRHDCINEAVVPAGYLGSVVWAGGILICCAHSQSAQCCALVILLVTILVLLYAIFGKVNRKDPVLPTLCVGIILLVSAVLYICWYTQWPHRYLMLEQVLLMLAAMSTLDATYSLLDDCILRVLPGSDSVRYADMRVGRTMCIRNPQVVGTVWFLIGIMAILGCVLVLLWNTYDPRDPERVTSIYGLSLYAKKVTSISTAVLAFSIVYRWQFSSKAWY